MFFLYIYTVNWLNVLAKHHNEWVNIVRSFGETNFQEDIVQEMYIRIHDANSGEKAILKDEPNRAFIWIILKNTYINYYKERQKFVKVDLDECRWLSIEEFEPQKHETICKIEDKIKDEILNWHTYEKELFRLHTQKSKSMREISNGANISLSSIFNTLKNCKNRIRETVGEDYQDYKNKEYDRI